jgi:hypothetical protein
MHVMRRWGTLCELTEVIGHCQYSCAEGKQSIAGKLALTDSIDAWGNDSKGPVFQASEAHAQDDVRFRRLATGTTTSTIPSVVSTATWVSGSSALHTSVCASTLCKWLSRKEGMTYRLPTEAEWEYACRAGTTTRYSSGDDPEALAKVANVADATIKAKFPTWKHPPIKTSDGYIFTSPVGSFKPNSFGLYDMHGNAWQWCADNYDENYYAKSPTDDPTGPVRLPLVGYAFILRGGSWHDGPMHARSAARNWETPDFRAGHTGFRVASDTENAGGKREEN